MKKLVFGLAMLASLSTFAISPVKKNVVKPTFFRICLKIRCSSGTEHYVDTDIATALACARLLCGNSSGVVSGA